jgi:hypothetical protein
MDSRWKIAGMTNGLLLPIRSERHTKNLGLNASRCPSLRLALPPRHLPLDGVERQAATLRRPTIDERHQLRMMGDEESLQISVFLKGHESRSRPPVLRNDHRPL